MSPASRLQAIILLEWPSSPFTRSLWVFEETLARVVGLCPTCQRTEGLLHRGMSPRISWGLGGTELRKPAGSRPEEPAFVSSTGRAALWTASPGGAGFHGTVRPAGNWEQCAEAGGSPPVCLRVCVPVQACDFKKNPTHAGPEKRPGERNRGGG